MLQRKEKTMSDSIQDVITKIREQQGFLIGRRSAQSLYAFLWGYAYARRAIEGGDDFHFLADFGSWVERRYKVTSTQGWAKIIEFYSIEEADELPLFWKLYDEYLEKASRNGRHSKQQKRAV
jgi:hypothetical protein